MSSYGPAESALGIGAPAWLRVVLALPLALASIVIAPLVLANELARAARESDLVVYRHLSPLPPEGQTPDGQAAADFHSAFVNTLLGLMGPIAVVLVALVWNWRAARSFIAIVFSLSVPTLAVSAIFGALLADRNAPVAGSALRPALAAAAGFLATWLVLAIAVRILTSAGGLLIETSLEASFRLRGPIGRLRIQHDRLLLDQLNSRRRAKAGRVTVEWADLAAVQAVDATADSVGSVGNGLALVCPAGAALRLVMKSDQEWLLPVVPADVGRAVQMCVGRARWVRTQSGPGASGRTRPVDRGGTGEGAARLWKSLGRAGPRGVARARPEIPARARPEIPARARPEIPATVAALTVIAGAQFVDLLARFGFETRWAVWLAGCLLLATVAGLWLRRSAVHQRRSERLSPTEVLGHGPERWTARTPLVSVEH